MLLVAIARHLDRARLQEVREGISELEIQKLAYFLQSLGAPLRLTFGRGTYGPYAAGLSRTPPTADPGQLAGRVASWSLRKARMFTDKHVRIATARLLERELLPA
ncbi:hypothetical protein [Plantactinospora sp. WMMB782]|uniref:hypothetical protein n=1 Tax=Plantactinospora sp. WMMB782 TaxID=3404121 RepID=UPI003B953E3E